MGKARLILDFRIQLREHGAMLTHKGIWLAIDGLARDHGMSPSGLAKRAGLDPTTFNKSKRHSRDGKPRWPSTESLSKILMATDSSVGDFMNILNGQAPSQTIARVPIVGFAAAGDQGYFDDAGYPVGNGWDEADFPGVTDASVYALEVAGDSMAPVYRDGDTIIVSPEAGIRRGDRVVVKTLAGEVMAKELRRKTAHRIELKSLNPDYPDRTLYLEDVDWIARVVWASQ